MIDFITAEEARNSIKKIDEVKLNSIFNTIRFNIEIGKTYCDVFSTLNKEEINYFSELGYRVLKKSPEFREKDGIYYMIFWV